MPDAFDACLPGRPASRDIPVVLYWRQLAAIPNTVTLGDLDTKKAVVLRSDLATENAVILGRDLDTKQEVTVTPEQLASGCYILGVQGVGKSTLLEQIAGQLLQRGESVIVFDPHGQLIDNLIRSMPGERVADTYHLDLKDREYPFGLNVFACADPADEEERDRTRHQVTHAFEKLWPETRTGVYFKKLLRHVIILLVENPQLTLADIPRLLRDDEFRERFCARLANGGSRDFWRYDYGALSPARRLTESGPLQTRIDELLAEPVITRILCQPRSTLNIRSIIDNRQSLLIRLPVNEDAYAKAAGLVGTMLMALVYAATFSYADVPEEERPGFSLIVDEFQNFATDEYARLFAQGRKFKAKQLLAHQYRDQLADTGMEANKAATLTAQTKVIFAVTKADALALADDFVPLEKRRETVNLDMTPTRLLDKHPHPVVKEFAKRVWKLEEGAAKKDSGWLDFGGGSRRFNPAVPRRVLELLNDLLYRAQQDRRLDEAAAAELVAALRPLLGHTEPDRLVWDLPGKEREYEQRTERLAWLRDHKLTRVKVSATLFRLLGEVTDRDTTVPIDLNLWSSRDAYRKRFVDLCVPSWEWINAQPEESLTRADKPIDENGRIPYHFRGRPAAIEAPLLSGDWGLTPTQHRDARVMLARWLWDEVTWWKNPPVKRRRRRQPARPAFQRVAYLSGASSWPGLWIAKLRDEEIETPLREARERQRRREQEIADTERRLDYLVATHRRAVAVEQTALVRFRHDLDRVVAALLDKPITVGQSKITNAEVVQSLQHMPRRQAYVRIGTAVHAMTARPPAERVDAEEGRRRVDQLRAQTRRDLCRQVSAGAPEAARPDPPARAKRSEAEGPTAPRTEPLAPGDADAAAPARTTPRRRTGRIHRSRPLPER